MSLDPQQAHLVSAPLAVPPARRWPREQQDLQSDR
ncbi:uncharacterized, partial [Tachysurus ichikawai]